MWRRGSAPRTARGVGATRRFAASAMVSPQGRIAFRLASHPLLNAMQPRTGSDGGQVGTFWAGRISVGEVVHIQLGIADNPITIPTAGAVRRGGY